MVYWECAFFVVFLLMMLGLFSGFRFVADLLLITVWGWACLLVLVFYFIAR